MGKGVSAGQPFPKVTKAHPPSLRRLRKTSSGAHGLSQSGKLGGQELVSFCRNEAPERKGLSQTPRAGPRTSLSGHSGSFSPEAPGSWGAGRTAPAPVAGSVHARLSGLPRACGRCGTPAPGHALSRTPAPDGLRVLPRKLLGAAHQLGDLRGTAVRGKPPGWREHRVRSMCLF